MACVNGSVSESHPSCQGMEGASMAYNRAVKRGMVKLIECKWPESSEDGACIAEYL